MHWICNNKSNGRKLIDTEHLVGVKVKRDPAHTWMASFTEGMTFNTGWVLEGFEQSEELKLSENLPQRTWEVQNVKFLIKRSGRSSVKETKHGLYFFLVYFVAI